jgi:hypothetical protein
MALQKRNYYPLSKEDKILHCHQREILAGKEQLEFVVDMILGATTNAARAKL